MVHLFQVGKLAEFVKTFDVVVGAITCSSIRVDYKREKVLPIYNKDPG